MALPAPAPPPPVVVTVGAPPSPRCLAFLATQDPLVQRTRFLPWTDHAAVGGAAATSSISSYVLLRHFAVRCSIGGLPADLAAANAHSVLTGALTGAAWSRILTEYVASGLLTMHFTKRRELLTAVKALQVNTPGNLALLAGDWLAAIEPFDTPPVVGAAAGRGRGRGAAAAVVAVPLIPGPAALKFVDLASVARLWDPSAHCPLEAFCILAGMLGPCSTRAIRMDAMSFVVTSAEILRANLTKFLGFGAAGASDGALAAQLGPFVITVMDNLTDLFAATDAGEFHLQREALAAFRFYFSSAEERSAVISDRIGFIDDRAPNLARFIIATAETHNVAYVNVCQLSDRFGLSAAPFVQRIAPLETACTFRIALFAAASQAPNANSTSITAAVLADLAAIAGPNGAASSSSGALVALPGGGGNDSNSFGPRCATTRSTSVWSRPSSRSARRLLTRATRCRTAVASICSRRHSRPSAPSSPGWSLRARTRSRARTGRSRSCTRCGATWAATSVMSWPWIRPPGWCRRALRSSRGATSSARPPNC